VLRLIKRHLKACAKTSENDFECEAKVGGLVDKAASKKMPKPRCPFYIVGPHPLSRSKTFKESTETSDQRVANAKLVQRETQFLLEPDKTQPKAVKTLGEAVTAFLKTKKDTSGARQGKFRRILCHQTVFLEERSMVVAPSSRKFRKRTWTSLWILGQERWLRGRRIVKM
jgi:hypothetical protein